ncbi:transcription factor-like protein DPB [Papaver somniferum]|uniref:transcription factor-like protein DPB n=1 Tax=Papaver somniferum TaxID=3469 RepID=UPI000E705095|nr:transcription factor-like protein DPB [Papaver somniferum]
MAKGITNGYRKVPASSNTYLDSHKHKKALINDIPSEYDDAWSAGNNKKNKAQTRAVGGGGEKVGGIGLRQFSIQVCKKVESKGRTTYNEVTDELVAELSTTTPSYMKPNYNEKNIRRRVYDSLNVLIAADIISKDENKEIQWRGMLHVDGLNVVEQLKSQYIGLRNKIANKVAYLQELEDQFVGLQNIAQQNEQLCCSGRKAETSGGVPLPFIIIQMPPPAIIELEMSEDMQLLQFDFNNIFQIHDNIFVLKSMGFCEGCLSRPKKNDLSKEFNPTICRSVH